MQELSRASLPATTVLRLLSDGAPTAVCSVGQVVVVPGAIFYHSGHFLRDFLANFEMKGGEKIIDLLKKSVQELSRASLPAATVHLQNHHLVPEIAI